MGWLRAYEVGVEHFHRGELEQAERCLHESLAHKHDLAAAHVYLGLILHKRGMLDDATDELLLASAFDRGMAEAWLYLGVVAIDRKDYGAARTFFESAIATRDGYAEAYNGLGKVHEVCEKFAQAAACYRRAIEINSGYALAYCNLAYVTMREKLDSAEAMTYVSKAIELDPRLADAYATKAMILQYEGLSEEAMAAAAAALQLNPALERARMLRALTRLMLGDFRQGWPDYEARRYVTPLMQIRKHPFPEWDGSDLRNMTILVYYEQAIGDEIMFASCLPDLLATGARCFVECSAKLAPLLRRSFPGVPFVVADQTSPDMSYLNALPRFDWQLAAGSLPLHFRRERGDFPHHRGYLNADPARVSYWRQRLDALGPGKKIGLAWSGGMHSSNRARRSMPLATLLPVMRIPGTRFVSLQYTPCADEIAGLERDHDVAIAHWQETIDDYCETAALVSALDLVISVQTAVVHLAGALAKPVWIMVPVTPEWRYMAHGTEMPWYPTARIFRQTGTGSWESLVKAVSEALADEVAPERVG